MGAVATTIMGRTLTNMRNELYHLQPLAFLRLQNWLSPMFPMTGGTVLFLNLLSIVNRPIVTLFAGLIRDRADVGMSGPESLDGLKRLLMALGTLRGEHMVCGR